MHFGIAESARWYSYAGMEYATIPISDDDISELARLARVDKRTILRRLAGLPMYGKTRKRVDIALAAVSIRPQPVYITLPDGGWGEVERKIYNLERGVHDDW